MVDLSIVVEQFTRGYFGDFIDLEVNFWFLHVWQGKIIHKVKETKQHKLLRAQTIQKKKVSFSTIIFLNKINI